MYLICECLQFFTIHKLRGHGVTLSVFVAKKDNTKLLLKRQRILCSYAIVTAISNKIISYLNGTVSRPQAISYSVN